MFDPDRLRSLLRSFTGKRILVVGDVLLDEYLAGSATRLSPEAPVPVVDIRMEYQALGGAGNVARNVIALGAECSLFGVVGADTAGRQIQDLVRQATGLVATGGCTTTRKTRVVAGGQQLVRLDRETVQEPPQAATLLMLDRVKSSLPRADGLIFADYGKGLLTPSLVNRIIIDAGLEAVPVFVDPKEHFGMFAGARLIKPNMLEAECFTSATGDEAINRIRMTVRTEVAITRGHAGMKVYDGTGLPVDVPTVPQELCDVQGAGDTAMAALALAKCAGATLLEAAVIANAAAGVVVGKPGTATATQQEVSEALAGVLEAWSEKHEEKCDVED